MKQFLDSNGNPLEIGHEYAIVTYGENGITPECSTEWYKAVWDGVRLVDEGGCTWTEWLEPAGEVSPDVIY